MKFEYTQEIKSLQYDYYHKYYKDTLNLPDYEDRIENRFFEEVNDAKFLKNILGELKITDIDTKKILIIGLGTGSVLKHLVEMGCKDIYGIEPNEDALKICHLKGSILQIDISKLTNHFAENMPFNDSSFDFIFSRSVFEHVQDLEKSFSETIRVLKSGGISYTNCPNYNYPLEDHFKIPAFTFFGRTVTKIFSILFRGKAEFIDSLQFTTPYKIDRILKKSKNIFYYRIYRSYSEAKTSSLKENIKVLFYKFFQKELNMVKTQEIVVVKK